LNRSKARKNLLIIGGIFLVFSIIVLNFKSQIEQSKELSYIVLGVLFGIVLSAFYFSSIINSKLRRRGWNDEQKTVVKRRQGWVCNRCKETPNNWEFHHRDGNRSNNDLSNCEGLCPNCHAKITHG